MKILVVTPYYEPAKGFGGPVLSVGALVSAMNAAGIETVVLSTDADGVRGRCVPDSGWQTRGGVRVHYAPCWGFSKPSAVGRYFFAPGIVPQLLNKLPGFDLLHVQGPWVFSTLVGSRASWLMGKPYVVSARGGLFPWAMGYKSFKKKVYLSLFENATLRRAARVHFTSALEARAAEANFPGLPQAVIPNPVAPGPPIVDGSEFRKRLGIGEAAPLVVFLGRIHPVKGLDLLVDVAAVVVRDVPGTVFALVGGDEGGHMSEIRNMVAKKGLGSSVLLPGEVDGEGKWSALAAADLFVLPSHQENFGMSAAEAMSCGIPVVTSATVGVAEDISEAGAGRVVDRTVKGFSGAIISLLRDASARRRMGESGRNLVATKYSPPAVVQSMIRMYGEVIEEHARRPVPMKARVCRSVFGPHSRGRS